MLRGNRGEWSEVYVLFRLLGEGRVYSADSDLNELPGRPFLPIIKIIRQERNTPKLNYCVAETITVCDDQGVVRASVEQEEIAAKADQLYYEIINLGGNERGSFSIPQIEAFMDSILVHSLKAPSSDKTDIILQVKDIHTGLDPVCGWSIKSELGSAPTLVNAGKTTNFVFSVDGISGSEAEVINEINTRSKVKDRLSTIRKNGSISFSNMENAIYERNLKLIDFMFPRIAAEALLLYYSGEAKTCLDAVSILEERDPLGIGKGMYEYKFKRFLIASSLGMNPATPWDGHEDATGGYVVVRSDGQVVAFHMYNKDMFEDYLLKTTRFETASTSRHEFGFLYKNGDHWKIKLNLQVRFI